VIVRRMLDWQHPANNVKKKKLEQFHSRLCRRREAASQSPAGRAMRRVEGNCTVRSDEMRAAYESASDSGERQNGPRYPQHRDGYKPFHQHRGREAPANGIAYYRVLEFMEKKSLAPADQCSRCKWMSPPLRTHYAPDKGSFYAPDHSRKNFDHERKPRHLRRRWEDGLSARTFAAGHHRGPSTVRNSFAFGCFWNPSGPAGNRKRNTKFRHAEMKSYQRNSRDRLDGKTPSSPAASAGCRTDTTTISSS